MRLYYPNGGGGGGGAITYAQLPSGGGTWANGGDLAITGGNLTLSGKLLFDATATYDVGVANAAGVVAATSPRNAYLTGVLVIGTRAQVPGTLPALHVVQPNAAVAARYDFFSAVLPFSFVKFNGTPTATTGSVTGDTLGGVAGFSTNVATPAGGPSARMSFIATQDGSVGRGAYLQLSTAPNGGALTSRWRVTEDGHLWPEANGLYDQGSAALRVRNLYVSSAVALGGFTVATLPAAPIIGMTVYVTDLLAPTYLAVAVGGGAVVGKVLYNGAAWVCA